jgi:ABC-2 type transport system permease protein
MGNMGIAFCGGYLGLIPLIALSMLQYSQQWQASDLFRYAPMRGPAAIYHGARRAVLLFLTLPILLVLGIIVGLLHGLNNQFFLLLPGIIAPKPYLFLLPLKKPDPPAVAQTCFWP